MDDLAGGGGGSNSRANPHFYLVLGGMDSIPNDDLQSFYRLGANTGDDYTFVVVDINSDGRLEEILKRFSKGTEFFYDLRLKAPAFMIADDSVQRIESLKNIVVIPVRKYDHDSDAIYRAMGIHSKSTRISAVIILKSLNRYLQLKPSIIGIGLNVNEIISDAIKALENKIY